MRPLVYDLELWLLDGGGGATSFTNGGSGGGINGGNSGGKGSHGAGGTQTGGYALGIGKSAASWEEAGAGGGYYGGNVGYYYEFGNNHGGGAGGSGYVQGMKGCIDLNRYAFTGNETTKSYGNYIFKNASMQNGVWNSHGYARIKFKAELDLKVTPNTTQWTNENVKLNYSAVDTESGIDKIVLPDNTETTNLTGKYEVEENGTYTFIVYNKNGNSKEVVSVVTNIDKDNPVGNVETKKTIWTTDDVTINWDFNDGSGSGMNRVVLPNNIATSETSGEYIAKENGEYIFIGYDNLGNSTEAKIQVYCIDRKAPEGSIIPNYTTWTNQNVELTWNFTETDNSKLKKVILPNNAVLEAKQGSGGMTDTEDVGKLDGVYTVTENGDYTFFAYDNAGNINEITININIIDTIAPKGDITGNTDEWRNTDIILNWNFTDDGESRLKNIKLPDETYSTSGIGNYTITQNGNYTFTAYDNSGNSIAKTVNVNKIDKIAPTIDLTSNNSTWINGKVNINWSVKDTGGSEIKNIRFPNGMYGEGTSGTYEVTQNGNYEFIVYDNSGNISKKTITVDKIDMENPEITVNANITKWTNTDVILNWSVTDTGGSNIKNVKLPDGTFFNVAIGTYTVTRNGEYTFICYDNAGNSITKSIEVDNIDKVLPTGTLVPNTTKLTNTDVILTWNVTDEGGSGFKEIKLPDGTFNSNTDGNYTVDDNGKYTFIVYDNGGNSKVLEIQVDNIIRSVPEGSVIQTPTTYTNKDVKLIWNFGDASTGGIYRVKLPDGLYSSSETGEFMVSQNGTYTFIGYNIAGSEKTISITVNNIDKENITGTVIPNTTNWTNTDVILTYNFSDTGVSGFANVRLPNGNTSTTQNGTYSVSKNGIYSFIAYDNAGNSIQKIIRVDNLDKEKPIGKVTKNIDKWTNENITLSWSFIDGGESRFKNTKLPDGSYSNVATGTYVITENGTYAFTGYDNAGNYTIVEITVNNIDKTLLKGTVEADITDWTNTEVILKWNFIDTGASKFYRVKLPNGLYQNDKTGEYAVTENGIYTFTGYDNAGNSIEIEIVISNIDTIKTVMTIIPSTTIWTNQDILLIWDVTDEGGSNFKEIELPDGTKSNKNTGGFTVKQNGIYKFISEDVAGNKTEVLVTVENIDKEEPEGLITQTPKDKIWVADNVTLKWKAIKNESGFQKIKLPDGSFSTDIEGSYIVSENGTYIFEVYDNAGNSKIIEKEVVNIDKVSPIIDIKVNISNTTSQNIEIEWEIDDEQSGVRNILLPNANMSYETRGKIEVIENGEYTFVCYDNVGNDTIKTIAINNIDKLGPTIVLEQENKEWTNDGVVINWKVLDNQSSVKETVLPDGTVTTDLEGSIIISRNGILTFVSYDNVQNRSEKQIEITNIDKLAPSIKLTNENVDLTNESIKIRWEIEDCQSGIQEIVLPDGSITTNYTGEYEINQNGEYVFIAYDNMGNQGLRKIQIDNINKEIPEIEIGVIYDDSGRSSIYWKVVGRVEEFDYIILPEGKITKEKEGQYEVKQNGIYTFIAYNKMGNCVIIEENIVK